MSKNFTYKEAYKPALYKWSFTNYSQSNINLISLIIKYLFQQRFFRLLSECLQHKVPTSELIEAIEELATHIAEFSINEQNHNILLRYFSFGLYCLKSYRVRFEQEKNTLFAFN